MHLSSASPKGRPRADMEDMGTLQHNYWGKCGKPYSRGECEDFSSV